MLRVPGELEGGKVDRGRDTQVTGRSMLHQPAKQIALILERGYEQYLLENYANADSRAEDIRGLALYAQRYESTETAASCVPGIAQPASMDRDSTAEASAFISFFPRIST